jgi:hypothetical protein
MAVDDDELVQAAQRGDEAAFRAVYRAPWIRPARPEAVDLLSGSTRPEGR